MQSDPDLWDDPIYAIGIAAEMVALHPQTLRRYEELGLLIPTRRAGRRLYSPRDIELLRQVSRLSQELGLNIAGIEVCTRLTARINELQAELAQAHTLRAEQESAQRGLEARISLLEDQLRQTNA